MNIVEREDAPGGYWLKVEIPNAYTDGSSRFERRFVSREKVDGKTPAQVQQALADAVTGDPLAPFIGQAVSAPTANKDILEDRMVAQYKRWQRWKDTRIEAQARGLAAAIITALTNQENAAWSDYANAINAWRLAPA